jgi:hypothetical protein
MEVWLSGITASATFYVILRLRVQALVSPKVFVLIVRGFVPFHSM